MILLKETNKGLVINPTIRNWKMWKIKKYFIIKQHAPKQPVTDSKRKKTKENQKHLVTNRNGNITYQNLQDTEKAF